MTMSHSRRVLAGALASLPAAAMLAAGPADAQDALPEPLDQPGKILLTVFLRHDETKTVDEINAHLRQTGWYQKFPPAGVEVVGWFVMMGIGQVAILRLPPEKLRETNRIIESAAWGGYRTEFYPTYDYKAIGEEAHAKAQTLP
jgi:hypothetical protein